MSCHRHRRDGCRRSSRLRGCSWRALAAHVMRSNVRRRVAVCGSLWRQVSRYRHRRHLHRQNPDDSWCRSAGHSRKYHTHPGWERSRRCRRRRDVERRTRCVGTCDRSRRWSGRRRSARQSGSRGRRTRFEIGLEGLKPEQGMIRQPDRKSRTESSALLVRSRTPRV